MSRRAKAAKDASAGSSAVQCRIDQGDSGALFKGGKQRARM